MLLDDVRAYLLANGLGNTWPVYIGFFPDDSDQMVGLFDAPGLPADTLGRENQRVGFQVRIRSGRQAYAVGRAMWQTIFNLLQDAQEGGGYLTGVYYIQAHSYSPLFFNDDRARCNFTSNFKVMSQANPGTT